MAERLTHYEVFYCATCKGIAEPFYTLNQLQEHLSALHSTPPPELPFKVVTPTAQSNGVTKAGARTHVTP